MAKIAFFAEKLPTQNDDISLFTYSLIQSLADQQHEIRIYTTDDELKWPVKNARIEIVRPFRKWNWFESLKLTPLLAMDSPEIIHIVQPRSQSLRSFGPSPLNMIGALTALPTKPKLVLSLYELNERALEKLGPLLTMANLILVRSPQQKEELSQHWKVASSKIKIIPVHSLPTLLENETEAVTDSVEEFLASNSSYLFIPGGLDQHKDFDEVISLASAIHAKESSVKFLIQGSISDLPISQRTKVQVSLSKLAAAGQILFTGIINRKTESKLFREATAVVLVTLDPSRLKFWRHSRMALTAGSPLVLSETQVRSDELNWNQNSQTPIAVPNSKIVEQCLRLLRDDAFRTNLQSAVRELADRQAMDMPSNNLSRLYSELLDQ